MIPLCSAIFFFLDLQMDWTQVLSFLLSLLQNGVFVLILWQYILEPSCCKKWEKSPNQETGLGNRGHLKVLNNTNMMTNLVSFRTLRRPLFTKPVSWLGYFLPFLTARQLY